MNIDAVIASHTDKHTDSFVADDDGTGRGHRNEKRLRAAAARRLPRVS